MTVHIILTRLSTAIFVKKLLKLIGNISKWRFKYAILKELKFKMMKKGIHLTLAEGIYAIKKLQNYDLCFYRIGKSMTGRIQF